MYIKTQSIKHLCLTLWTFFIWETSREKEQQRKLAPGKYNVHSVVSANNCDAVCSEDR